MAALKTIKISVTPAKIADDERLILVDIKPFKGSLKVCFDKDWHHPMLLVKSVDNFTVNGKPCSVLLKYVNLEKDPISFVYWQSDIFYKLTGLGAPCYVKPLNELIFAQINELLIDKTLLYADELRVAQGQVKSAKDGIAYAKRQVLDKEAQLIKVQKELDKIVKRNAAYQKSLSKKVNK